MAALVENRQAPCVVLGRGLGGLAERSVSAAFGGHAPEPAGGLEGVVVQRVRASAGADGVLRAGLLVPLGRRESAPAGWDVPDVVNVDDWEEDDDMVDDDDDEEDEEDEDDEFFPDDTDEFEDDEDSDEDEADE